MAPGGRALVQNGCVYSQVFGVGLATLYRYFAGDST